MFLNFLFNRFAHSAGPSCEAGSGDVACGCGGERGGMRNGGGDGEMCRHSVPPLAWERGSHDINKMVPGVRNPWFMASGGLPGRLGRQVRLRRAV